MCLFGKFLTPISKRKNEKKENKEESGVKKETQQNVS